MSPLFLLPLLCLALTRLAEAGGDVTMGVAYDDLTGVGGVVRGCVEGGARGEDGVNYCKKLTPQETLRLKQEAEDLVVLTIRRPGEEAFKRFLRSARVYGYKVKVLGEEGEGVEEEVGGRRRIQLLQEALSILKEEKKDRLVLYTESVDVVFSGDPMRVVEEVQEVDDVDVLVSADGFCWPGKEVEGDYPQVEKGTRFLNSGGFVGRVGVLHKLLTEEGTEEIKKLEKKKKDEKKEEEKTKEKKVEGKEEKKKKKKEEKRKEEEEEEEEKHALQVLLTRVYLKESLRHKYKMEIDHESKVFQNLNGAAGEVELRFAGREGYLQNTAHGTVPVVVRGNGYAHLLLHTLGSYLARAWNPEDGCRSCWEDMIQLEDAEEWRESEEKKEKERQEEVEEYGGKKEVREVPRVTLGVFLEKPTPFLEEFLERVEELKFPKEKIDLYLHNAVEGHEGVVEAWLEGHRAIYASVKYIPSKENVKEWHARNGVIDHCLDHDCEYLFVVDAEARLLNPYTLKLLIEQNRPMVAPLLIRPYKAWSNFWGAVTRDGFYARSLDYMEIVQGQRRGLWNVPYVSGSYLIQRSVLTNARTRPSYVRNLLDPDMALCENLREKGVFLHVSNRVEFGHLVNNDEFDLRRLNPELWEVDRNRWDWERRYLNPAYPESVAENTTVEMPCPDVYWFPVFTERFAKEMIATFEDYGAWSDGSNDQYSRTTTTTTTTTGSPMQAAIKSVGLGGAWQHILATYISPMAKKIFRGYDRVDPRLEGGYESVPTIDIHMKQMNMEEEWLEILRSYIQPMQLKVFQGYNNDVGPPRAIMNFMVRYKPDEQPFLRPHHDTSTYTINVALNKPGKDYEGGGCRFVRYNCNVTDSRVGWVLMHPGRLTHLHEGLRTTKGTRYIIVSFVDP